MKNASPLRLVQYIVSGSLLMVFAYAADFLPVLAPGPNHRLWDLRFVLVLLMEIFPFLLGGALVWRSLTLLGKGIRLDSWTEAQLAAARGWTSSSAYNWFIGLLLMGSLAVWFAGLILHRHWNLAVLILLANPLIGAKAKVAIPRPRPKPFTWEGLQPIRSEHWGSHGITE